MDEAYATTFRAQHPRLVALAWRVLGDRAEAEDVAQEALLRLHGAEVRERPDAEVAAWLRRVAMNLAFNRARDRSRATVRAERTARLEPAPAVEGVVDAVLAREEAESVRAALVALPERQRAVLLLRHSGYRYAEIAETLGIAVGSVGVLLARAERAFRRAWEFEDHDPLP